MKGRDQKTVIAAGQIAADGPGGVAADAVGDQPFALFGNFERAADLAAEFDRSAGREGRGLSLPRGICTFLRGRHVSAASILDSRDDSAFGLFWLQRIGKISRQARIGPQRFLMESL